MPMRERSEEEAEQYPRKDQIAQHKDCRYFDPVFLISVFAG
ncbi:hypothetical protein Metev_0451 [Methanohalobium evestigatum Z-7303]|uniref:Uncharacterized protein n=2 Tax=Methanohalobium evestigatum TaxID=2322 RepID=D7E824_METEZ|nr:hypothetical protein Metev_0451 [Methanohalobium evestigatum Z-7303]